MGLFSSGTIIANTIDKNYDNTEFIAAVMLRELFALEDFPKLQKRFTDTEWEMLISEMIDFYYSNEKIAAQSIGWAARDLIDNERAVTFNFTESGVMIQPDYEPDSAIKFQDALWEEIIAFD